MARRRRSGGGLAGSPLEHTQIARDILDSAERGGGCYGLVRKLGAARAHIEMAERERRGVLRRELFRIERKMGTRCDCGPTSLSGLGCPGDARVVLQGFGRKRRRR